MYVCLSVRLPVCKIMYHYVCMYVCMYVCLSLSVVCLSVYVFVFLLPVFVLCLLLITANYVLTLTG